MLGHLIFVYYICKKATHHLSFSRNFVNRTLLNTWNSATIVRPFGGPHTPLLTVFIKHGVETSK